MNRFEVAYQFVLADLRERTRRYSFLLTLGSVFFYGYLVMTGKYALIIGGCRGEYNSAFVGSLMALACTPILGMVGFFLIKNTITRDRTTGVGEIIATTPIGKPLYVISKFISNLCILGLIIFILSLGAVVMQLAGGSERNLDLIALLTPFLFLTVPAAILTSAAAVFFESVRWLRGSVGNVLYFFMAEFFFVAALFLQTPLMDNAGINLFETSMKAAVAAQYPDVSLSTEMGFVGLVNPEAFASLQSYHWEGIDWGVEMLLPRLFWVGVALLVVYLGALLLNRFDPAMEKLPRIRRKKKKTTQVESAPLSTAAELSVTELVPARLRFNWMTMLIAELRLMLKSMHWIWYLVCLAMIVVPMVIPYEFVRSILVPATLIWPLMVWSSMGTREARFGTNQLLYSSAYPLRRQLPATWVAGFLIALGIGSGVAVRALMAGEPAHFGALMIAAIFAPSLALALGVLSGSKKLFEIVYLVLWYVGPANKAVPLDFAGSSDAAIAFGAPIVFLAITLILVPLALVARRRQVSV